MYSEIGHFCGIFSIKPKFIGFQWKWVNTYIGEVNNAMAGWITGSGWRRCKFSDQVAVEKL